MVGPSTPQEGDDKLLPKADTPAEAPKADSVDEVKNDARADAADLMASDPNDAPLSRDDFDKLLDELDTPAAETPVATPASAEVVNDYDSKKKRLERLEQAPRVGKNLITSENVATILRINHDDLSEARQNNVIFGRRDGPNWHYFDSEVKRIIEEEDIPANDTVPEGTEWAPHATDPLDGLDPPAPLEEPPSPKIIEEKGTREEILEERKKRWEEAKTHARFLTAEVTAVIFNTTPEAIIEARNKGIIFGYRDGASFKFKAEEVERVLNEEDKEQTINPIIPTEESDDDAWDLDPPAEEDAVVDLDERQKTDDDSFSLSGSGISAPSDSTTEDVTSRFHASLKSKLGDLRAQLVIASGNVLKDDIKILFDISDDQLDEAVDSGLLQFKDDKEPPAFDLQKIQQVYMDDARWDEIHNIVAPASEDDDLDDVTIDDPDFVAHIEKVLGAVDHSRVFTADEVMKLLEIPNDVVLHQAVDRGLIKPMDATETRFDWTSVENAYGERYSQRWSDIRTLSEEGESSDDEFFSNPNDALGDDEDEATSIEDASLNRHIENMLGPDWRSKMPGGAFSSADTATILRLSEQGLQEACEANLIEPLANGRYLYERILDAYINIRARDPQWMALGSADQARTAQRNATETVSGENAEFNAHITSVLGPSWRLNDFHDRKFKSSHAAAILGVRPEAYHYALQGHIIQEQPRGYLPYEEALRAYQDIARNSLDWQAANAEADELIRLRNDPTNHPPAGPSAAPHAPHRPHAPRQNAIPQMPRMPRTVGGRLLYPLTFLGWGVPAAMTAVKPLISNYRKARDRNQVVSTLDSYGRGTAGAVSGYLASGTLVNTFGSSLSAAAVSGGGLMSNIVAPLSIPLAAPGITLIGRRLYAGTHEVTVENEYQNALGNILQNVGTQDAHEEFEAHRAHSTFASHNKSQVDMFHEKDLVHVMAEHAHCSPAEVPYLGSDDRYARYMFAKFTETIAHLHEQSKQPNSRLNPKDKDVVDLFHIEEGNDPQSGTPEKKMQILKDLWDVSQEYGKLIAYEHRKKRNTQLYTQVAGGALTSMPVLGFVPPLIVGGLTVGARWLYTEAYKPKGLSFDKNGHLQVSMAAMKHSDDSKSLATHDIFNRELTADNMTDAHKHWISLMKFDKHVLHDPMITSAEGFAFRLQEAAMKQIAGKSLPAAKVKDEVLKAADDEFKEQNDKLRLLTNDVRAKTGELTDAREEMEEKQEVVGAAGVSADRKAEATAALGRLRKKVGRLEREIQEVRSRIDGPDGQEAVTKAAKDKLAKLKDPAASALKLSADSTNVLDIDSYPKNANGEVIDRAKFESAIEIIREAFAFKVKTEWEKRESHAKPSILAGTGGALKNAAFNSAGGLAKEAGLFVVNGAGAPLAVAALSAVAYQFSPALVNAIYSIVPAEYVYLGAFGYGALKYLQTRMSDGIKGFSFSALIGGKDKKKVEGEVKAEVKKADHH